MWYFLRTFILRYRYNTTLTRLKNEFGHRKFLVGFIVSEIAKWKGQSLYDLMDSSSLFEPIILIIPSHYEYQYETNRIDDFIKNKIDYFRKDNINAISIWDSKKNSTISEKKIGVDLIFYQQPWDKHPSFTRISRYALTFYFPYYLFNGFKFELDLGLSLHKSVFRYIVQNNKLVEFYEGQVKSFLYAGQFVGWGHPITDFFYLRNNQQKVKHYVIYAPHFSFQSERRKSYMAYYSSTFLENGRLILDYAKTHSDINWVFKPHPRLYTELINCAGWSKEEADSYYSEWAKIGLTCYDSHYLDYFNESKVMITDCSSFLTEYSCTGNPIIRPVPGDGHTLLTPSPMLISLYNTFYESHNNEELISLLDSIVINGEDPNKESRIACLDETKLTGSYSARNIVEGIKSIFNTH